ncbi:MAG TPA: HAD-IA family hydrolase, partial [Candidatus Omnitrophota bacterium]|nr:HAD-IA family hydrolase [Candidatus Omnitrophota bacterium]
MGQAGKLRKLEGPLDFAALDGGALVGIFEAVIFEVDGVIFDTTPVWVIAWNRVFKENGGPEVDLEFYDHNLNGRKGRESLKKWFPDLRSDEIDRCHAAVHKYYLEFLAHDGIKKFESTIRLIQRLHASGVPLAVGSGSDVSVKLLTDVGLIGYFTAVVTSKDVTHGKPHPDMFLLAAKKLGVFPAKTLVIGDAVADMEAARAGGFFGLGLARLGNEDELRAAGAQIVAKDIKNIDICPMIKKVAVYKDGGEDAVDRARRKGILKDAKLPVDDANGVRLTNTTAEAQRQRTKKEGAKRTFTLKDGGIGSISIRVLKNIFGAVLQLRLTVTRHYFSSRLSTVNAFELSEKNGSGLFVDETAIVIYIIPSISQKTSPQNVPASGLKCFLLPKDFIKDGGIKKDVSQWLIAFDYDGTLTDLDPDSVYFKQVPPALQGAIIEALNKGALGAIVSGRGPKFVYDELSAKTGILSGIRDPRRLIFLGELGGHIGYCTEQCEFVRDIEYSLELSEALQAKILSAVKEKLTELGLIDDLVMEGTPGKIVLNDRKRSSRTLKFNEPEYRQYAPQVVQYLEQRLSEDGIYVFNNNNVAIDIGLTAKGRALKDLAARSGIPAERIFVAGDSENDLDMLELVFEGATGAFVRNFDVIPAALKEKLILVNDPEELAVVLKGMFDLDGAAFIPAAADRPLTENEERELTDIVNAYAGRMDPMYYSTYYLDEKTIVIDRLRSRGYHEIADILASLQVARAPPQLRDEISHLASQLIPAVTVFTAGLKDTIIVLNGTGLRRALLVTAFMAAYRGINERSDIYASAHAFADAVLAAPGKDGGKYIRRFLITARFMGEDGTPNIRLIKPFCLALSVSLFIGAFATIMLVSSVFGFIALVSSVWSIVFLCAGFNKLVLPRTDDHLPFISVVLPVYNEERDVAKTIISCIENGYPLDRMELIAVNDGCQDNSGTVLEYIKAYARDRYGFEITVLHHEVNKGKQEAMATGVRRTSEHSDIIISLDSDTIVDKGSFRRLVQFFKDERVGAACGHCDVVNHDVNMLTRFQATWYFFMFRIVKAAESAFGDVTCCPGVFTATRRDLVLATLDEFLSEKFCTVGEDRHLTNIILARGYKIYYHPRAVARTAVPENFRQFFKQQLRWKRSHFYETARLLLTPSNWPAHPFAVGISLIAMSSTFFFSPLVIILIGINWLILGIPAWTYIVCSTMMAAVLSLFYYYENRRTNFYFGIGQFYFSMLLFDHLSFIALATMADNNWGTRGMVNKLPNGYQKPSGAVTAEVLAERAIDIDWEKPVSVEKTPLSRGLALAQGAAMLMPLIYGTYLMLDVPFAHLRANILSFLQYHAQSVNNSAGLQSALFDPTSVLWGDLTTAAVTGGSFLLEHWGSVLVIISFAIVTLISAREARKEKAVGPAAKEAMGTWKNDVEPDQDYLIFLPLYNEAKNIRHIVELAREYGYLGQCLFIDDGSTDATADILRELSETRGINAFFGTRNRKKIGQIKAALDSLSENHKLPRRVILIDGDSFLWTRDGSALTIKNKLRDIFILMDRNDWQAVGLKDVPYLDRGSGMLQQVQYYEYISDRMLHTIFCRHGNMRCIPGAGGVFNTAPLMRALGNHSLDHDGDDMEVTVLLQQHGYRVGYFNDDLEIKTIVPSTLRRLFSQRIRWRRGALKTYMRYRGFYWQEIKKGSALGIYSLVEMTRYVTFFGFLIPFFLNPIMTTIIAVAYSIVSQGFLMVMNPEFKKEYRDEAFLYMVPQGILTFFLDVITSPIATIEFLLGRIKCPKATVDSVPPENSLRRYIGNPATFAAFTCVLAFGIWAAPFISACILYTPAMGILSAAVSGAGWGIFAPAATGASAFFAEYAVGIAGVTVFTLGILAAYYRFSMAKQPAGSSLAEDIDRIAPDVKDIIYRRKLLRGVSQKINEYNASRQIGFFSPLSAKRASANNPLAKGLLMIGTWIWDILTLMILYRFFLRHFLVPAGLAFHGYANRVPEPLLRQFIMETREEIDAAYMPHAKGKILRILSRAATLQPFFNIMDGVIVRYADRTRASRGTTGGAALALMTGAIALTRGAVSFLSQRLFLAILGMRIGPAILYFFLDPVWLNTPLSSIVLPVAGMFVVTPELLLNSMIVVAFLDLPVVIKIWQAQFADRSVRSPARKASRLTAVTLASDTISMVLVGPEMMMALGITA